MKQAALRKAGDDNAEAAFEAMPDPDAQGELYPRCHDQHSLFTLFDRAP